MFKVHSASVARKAVTNVNPTKWQSHPLVLTDKSPITGTAQELVYKSTSEIRRFFSGIFGNVLECTPDSGYKRITRVTSSGTRKIEKKIYPGGDKFVVTKFEVNGKTPKSRTVYAKKADGKYEVVNAAKYRNGELFYSYSINFDGTYQRVQHLANNMIHFDSGIVGKKGEPISTFITDFESTAPSRKKVKPQKYTDGAILKVKAEDIDNYKKGWRRSRLHKQKNVDNKLTQALVRSGITDDVEAKNYIRKLALKIKKSNIGLIMIDSMNHKEFRGFVLRNRRASWAFQNLHNWKMPVTWPNGLDRLCHVNKADVHDVYILRSGDARNAYSPNEQALNEAKTLASNRVKQYRQKIRDSRDGEGYETTDIPTIGGARITIADDFGNEPPIDPEYDDDFIDAANYLIYSDLNKYFTEYTKIVAKDLNLKPVEYKPKTKAQRAQEREIAKEQRRAKVETAKAKAANVINIAG